jgi:hypothetical protein
MFTACSGLIGSAHAQCSNMSAKPLVAFRNLPPSTPAIQSLGNREEAAREDGPASTSIVGLWQVNFVSGGQIVDQAFEAFHSDNTEIMVDTSAPASDNVCIGVWAQTNGNTIKLNHPSWTFDSNGNLNGTATIRTTVTAGPHANTFAGTFTVDVFDLAGNKILHLAGTVTGKRITAD